MKRILLAVMTWTTCIAHAQQTLTVIDQNYDLALNTAAQQHKLLIVDFYTTWCMPCKELDKTIFKNDTIAAAIGKHFVVLKYDAEKDSIYNLSLKHHICSYPTTVILTPGGRLIHKMYGMGGPGSLVENYKNLLHQSIQLNEQGKYLEGYSVTIEPDAYPEFYKKYVRRIADIRPGDLENYWAGNTGPLTEVNVAILAYFSKAPEAVNLYFLQHRAEYEKRFGKTDVAFITEHIISDKFTDAIAAKDEARYKAAVQIARQYLPPGDVDKYLSFFGLEMYMAQNEWSKAISLVEKQTHNKTISANSINAFCWNVFEKCQDKKTIIRAVQLMKQITDSHPLFPMLDTYAHLLAKSGDKKQAIIVMQRAIETGKANGEDTKESEEALSRF